MNNLVALQGGMPTRELDAQAVRTALTEAVHAVVAELGHDALARFFDGYKMSVDSHKAAA